MKDTAAPISRTAMSPREREFRSRLAQLVSGRGLLRGALQERHLRCGKASCRCTKGRPHRAVCLVLRQGGRLRQLHVPAAWEPRVRQWVANHHTLKGLLTELSDLYWEQVRQRQG